MKNIKKYKIFLVILLLGVFPLEAEENKKPGVIQKRYIHVCPKGTKKVGEGHPGSSVVFCKQELYKGSRLEGGYAKFYRNGNKQFEGNYEQGKKHGKWTTYYRTGELKEVKKFENGAITKSSLFKQDGTEIKSKNSAANTSEEGKIYSELRQSKKGIKASNSIDKSMGWPKKTR